jgi:glycosyltransferase involved in cell wall biosynthesis
MKVCIFALHDCNKYYISVRKLVRSLVATGYDVRVIALLSQQTSHYEESDGARIFRVTNDPVLIARQLLHIPITIVKSIFHFISNVQHKLFHRNIPKKETNDTKLYLKQRKTNIIDVLIFQVISLISNSRYIWYLIYYVSCLRLVRQEKADIYHANDLVTLPIAWVCKVLYGGRLLYYSHELWLDLPGRKRTKLNKYFIRHIESFLIKRTDANIIAGESSSKELAKRYKISPPFVILNVPTFYPYEPSRLFRDRFKIPPTHKIALYMGVISPGRGIEQAIQSIEYLSNCVLVIFGFAYSQQYIDKLNEHIKNIGVMKKVYFYDAVPFDEVTRCAMSADVGLVLHQNISLNYYFVSPNKLFECMAAGLPVVGSNFPDIKRFVEEYKFGITCNQEDPKEIARSVDYILSNNERYISMKKNALEAAKIYNWEIESKKFQNIYHGLSMQK